jgi:RimJ/RimL family protein N-acetyltransferase
MQKMQQTETDFQGEKPIFNIVGDKVALGPVHKKLVPDRVRWENDFAVALLSGDPLRPVSPESLEADFEQDIKKADDRGVDFAIYERATSRHIGGAGLRHINRTHRNAEYGIMIGEKDCWGKGYGTETTILILDYAFTVLGLHNVLLSTYAYNERAVRAYTRAGFRVIGRQREAARMGNQVYDIIFMDCLATEFRSPLKRVIELP